MSAALKAPFPWFGGKSRVAHIVWPRFGDCLNYVEPFAGSLAVLLTRPFPVRIETINDKDCYVSNFWRALSHDPDCVAHYADWPVNECDLHARHLWLVNQVDFRERMMSDPEYYDAKIAGWWVWGLCAWIGSGWCDISKATGGNVATTDGRMRPHLKSIDGVHKLTQQRPNLRPKQGIEGLPRQLPAISERPGSMGIHGPAISRQLPHLSGDSGTAGAGIHASAFDGKTGGLYAYMQALAERLRRVRVTCGDWERIMGPSVTWKIGTTAVFLDPPYSGETERQDNLYAQDCLKVAHDVRAWCLENGDNPKLRIALCGYQGEHDELQAAGWDCVPWKANGGYGGQRKGKVKNVNAGRERVWFSPHCLSVGVANGRHDPRDYSTLFSQESQP